MIALVALLALQPIGPVRAPSAVVYRDVQLAQLLQRLHDLKTEYRDDAPEVRAVQEEIRTLGLWIQKHRDPTRYPFLTSEMQRSLRSRDLFYRKSDEKDVQRMPICRPRP